MITVLKWTRCFNGVFVCRRSKASHPVQLLYAAAAADPVDHTRRRRGVSGASETVPRTCAARRRLHVVHPLSGHRALASPVRWRVTPLRTRTTSCRSNFTGSLVPVKLAGSVRRSRGNGTAHGPNRQRNRQQLRESSLLLKHGFVYLFPTSEWRVLKETYRFGGELLVGQWQNNCLPFDGAAKLLYKTCKSNCRNSVSRESFLSWTLLLSRYSGPKMCFGRA